MRKTTFKWLTVFAAGAALFDGCVLLLTTGVSCGGDSKGMRVLGDFQSMGSALKSYVIGAGRPPTTNQGLEALIVRPTTAPLPRDWVRIWDSVPTDPWQKPYHYRELPASVGRSRWELRSGGPDESLWTADDLHSEFESNCYP